MNKKTIALTLLSLASVFALSTTAVKAEENDPAADVTETTTTTNLTTQGAGINFFNKTESLNFEDFVINGKNAKQQSKATSDISLTVSDLRGTREGWVVTARHTGVESSKSGKEDELKGATISLSGGTLTDSLGERINLNNITINKDEATIYNAKAESGMGNWTHLWEPAGITLIIPTDEARDMYASEYSTTITWTLAATPQAETATAE